MAVAPLLLTCLCATAKAEADPACRSEWLPLETGNYWVYQSSTRFVTNSFHTLRVLGTYELSGQVWCQMEDAGRLFFLRTDKEGRIFQRSLQSAAESIYLDPRGLKPYTLTSNLGFTAQAIDYSPSASLSRDTSTYASGLGRTSSSSFIATGSNGGFSGSDSLLEMRISDKIYRVIPTPPEITLSLDPSFANCAIPCYYAACGIGSPVDPPMALKPCLGARTAGTNLPGNSLLRLSIADATGTTRYEQYIPKAAGASVQFISLPFYYQERTGTPITLFPPGDYIVTLWLLDPAGKLAAAATSQTKLN